MRVDFHTHILPGIDDGAKNEDVSLAMLEALSLDGVTDVILTPHFYFRSRRIDDFLERRQTAYEKLLAVAPDNIRFHLGAEAEFSMIDIGYECYKDLSIDGGKYILLELPYKGDFGSGIFERLERLIYSTGLRPIIAHTERYESIRKDPGQIADLISLGCLIQINAESVLSIRQGSLEDAIFQNREAHLIGTDCHDMERRPPKYLDAMQFLEDRYGKELVSDIERISERVVNGDKVHPSGGKRIKKSLFRYK